MHEITEKEGIKRIDIFNENWYKIDENTFYPSVTFIQGHTIEPSLANWFKEVGKQADIIADEAKQVGSLFHECIEILLKHGYIDYNIANNNFKVWTRVNNFMNFWDKHLKGHKIIGIEQQVINHNLQYAGTLDLLTEKDGLHIWDWKTSKTVQDHHKSQISAYAKCYKDVVSANVVCFPERPTTVQGYSLTSLNNVYIDYYFEHFKWMYDGFKLKYKEPKFKSLPFEFKINLENYKNNLDNK